MKKQQLFYFLNLTLFLLSLAGCGGNESYISSRSSVAVPFSGVVEDGPIAGAKVSLRDKVGTLYPLYDSQNHTNYEIKTDASGKFSLEVNAGIDSSALSVVAVGGVDSATGMDFHNIEMRCPYELFQGVVSPVTTLVAVLHAQGFTYAEAQTRVREWLALPDNIDLMSSPATNLDLQRRTLLLSKIALEMKVARPFQAISLMIAAAETSLLQRDEDGGYGCDPLVLSTLGLTGLETERISNLQELLDQLNPEINTPDAAFVIVKSEELNKLFDASFRERLELSPPFDENYQKNIKVLTEKTLLAAGDEVFLLVDPIPQRLFRYIFSTYMASDPTSSNPQKTLSPQEKLLLDPLEFATILTSGNIPLENDPWIALLARSRVPNGVETPLLWDELPGNDNQRRVAYFYGSDVSPHYRAEQLIGKVFDDNVNDVVLLEIVKGKANAGLIAEAQEIIPTQIVQGEYKADAYRAIGEALISFGRLAAAREDLARAFALYRKVIDGPRLAADAGRDAIRLQETAEAFRKAGFLNDAETVLLYLSQVADKLVSNTNAYGSLLVATWSVADVYIAAGDFPGATPVVESLYSFALKYPPTLTGNVMTYRWRIYYLVETSKRYAALGNRNKVQEIYSKIQDLRTSDGYQNLTGADSWGYIPGLVGSLFLVGETEKAKVLANSIPESYSNAIGNVTSGLATRASAFKIVASYEALLGSLDPAFGYVETYLSKPEDKLEALTYFAANKGVKYIGMNLINAGRFDEARIVLTKAEEVLAGMTQTTDQNRYTYLIKYGYVKLADLYFMIGDVNKAAALLLQAQRVIDEISGVKFVVDGLIDIALGYEQIGQPEIFLTLLQDAGSRVDAMAGGGLVLPKDMALLYEALIKAYLQIGNNDHTYEKVLSFLRWSYDIHTPGFAYTGTSNDDLASTEVDYLLRAAKYMVSLGHRDEAISILDEASHTADSIYDPSKRLKKYIEDPISNPTINHIVGGYANAGNYNQALGLALGIADTTSRDQAMEFLAIFSMSSDDFPDTWVASIDSDGDGKPDFFNPMASADEIAASGLILDDNCDGDGIVDILDIRPLFKD